MVKSTNRPGRSRLGQIAAGLALGAMLAGSLAAPALAQPRRGHVVVAHPVDRAWNVHATRAYHDWHRPHHIAPPPRVVYTPPVVYSEPPPEPAGINLILPLNFR